MTFLTIQPGHVTQLAGGGDIPEAAHQFDADQIRAVNAALAARRPLLVRGEPGSGKSQLARAAAKELRRSFVQHVVDARTEARDLQWHFDAVARLADAQLHAALHGGRTAEETRHAVDTLRATLAVENYLHPRALWWAFDWKDAEAQAAKVEVTAPKQPDSGSLGNGCVLLIDEIDKAESDVPNGLLEALGSGCFTPQGRHHPVAVTGHHPLVIVTTNEERSLPDAFIRRCLVLHLALPSEHGELVTWLQGRGLTHFKDRTDTQVLEQAALMLAKDRRIAMEKHWLPLPGQAEYLDLVRAVIEQHPGDFAAQEKLLGQVKRFVLEKHPDAAARGEDKV